MNTQPAPNEESGMDPRDAISILLLACTITLFVLWLAGTVARNPTVLQLPDFIKTAYSKIWSYIIGLSSSTLLAFFGPKQTRRPNYLTWSLGTTVVLLGLAFVVARAMPTPPPTTTPPPQDVLLRFWATFDKSQHPILDFHQNKPRFLEDRRIAPDGSDSHYQEYVAWPTTNQQLEALALRIANTSESVNAPDKPMGICFTRNTSPPTNQPPFEVRMRCQEGTQCKFAPDDFGWASPCPAADKHTARFSLMPEAHAQSTEDTASKPGWRVPSLATLQQMSDSERAGYTQFTIKSNSVSSLKDAKSFRYAIVANGSPLYVDGWPPADMLKGFDPSKGLDFSFGMQNLSFSGADKGCENIAVTLEFLSGDETIKKVQLTRLYAALRDAPEEQTDASDGMRLTWAGTYMKPKKEDKSEIFILSTSAIGEASRTKSRIDQAHLSYDGMDLVGVLRPPLNKPEYGLVLGLRQATGQIKFTFDPVYVQKMLAWSKEARSTHEGVFPHPPFIYQMKTGESGVGELGSCTTKAPIA
jgi:hypothetical protein